MAKTKYVERLLIVLNRDGSLKGAAQYPLTVWDDPEIPDKQGDGEVVDPETLAAILPDRAGALAQLSQALALVDADKKEIDRLAGDLQRAEADVANRIEGKKVLDARIAELEAENAQFRSDASTMRSRIGQFEVELGKAKQ